ncbi:claudin-15 [Athene noctua]|uniref:claudin-15 n=1 Tax=Athene noctua TaxID=126797 RepID=UPI003EB92BDB
MCPGGGWGVTLGVALGAAGWGLLVASLPHGAWGLAGGQATAVATVTVTRGLWSDCATDASGVTSCVPLVSLITLPGYLQGSRALAVTAATLGALGVVLGGAAGTRRRARAAGGALLLLAALGALAAASWFAAAVTREFFDPQHGGVRYEPGPGLMLAAGGGALAGVGGGALLAAARGPPERPRAPSLGDKYGRNVYV